MNAQKKRFEVKILSFALIKLWSGKLLFFFSLSLSLFLCLTALRMCVCVYINITLYRVFKRTEPLSFDSPADVCVRVYKYYFVSCI